MANAHAERRLAAILAADVVGYSHLIEQDEAATLAALKGLRQQVIDPLLAEHKGRIVKLMGDGALVEFGSVVDAVACAVAVQRGVAERQAAVPPERRIVFRIGINLGDVVVEGEDLFGDGVNIAARLEQLCEPGGVLISGTAYDHLQGRLGLPIEDAGEQQVKNLERPVRVYRVRLDGVAAPATRYRRPGLRRPLGRVLVPVAAAVLLLVAGVGWWLWPTAPAGTGRPGIAVLPFDNLGGDEATGRLADGITEDIITDLARFRDLDVIARNSTGVYKGRPVDVREVGRELGVGYVLEGSIQRQGERVRITAQLIDAGTGAHAWSDRFDRPAQDVFAVQTEIADKVANTLGGYTGLIAKSDTLAAKRKRPGDLSAYDLYMMGIEAKQRGTEESVAQAIVLLERAVQEDPQLARAWTGLAWAYGRRANWAADPAGLRQKSLEAARRSVELDPLDGEAHAALGDALGMLGDFKQTKLQFEEALRLNPNAPDILSFYAGWASGFGQAENGAEAAERAMRLNPSFPVWAAGLYRYAFFMVGRYEDALRAGERRPEETWTPNDYAMVAGSLAALGRLDEAKAVVARGMARFPDMLVIESFASRPDWAEHERQRLIETMRKAGFPFCAKPEELAKFEKPVRLPEFDAEQAKAAAPKT
jgi:TolB-like protein/class 3 adenylate cyclase/tetratricopeptide (TPR) repeat protein